MAATAYTPGLKISAFTDVLKERRLPLKGTVLVKKGDRVESDTIVAKTDLPGRVDLLNVANKLGLDPKEVPECMFYKAGDRVEKGVKLAETKGFFGWFKSQLPSPATGTIESVSAVTGQVVIRHPPIPVEVRAYIDGEIDEVIPQEGVVVRAKGTFLQGIFGIGGETTGELTLAVKDPGETLQVENITEAHKDKIVIGGCRVTAKALDHAVKCGVRGIIVGGFDDKDLKDFLGYDLGVAITGNEEKGITLVVTEGFGDIRMAEKTFALLKAGVGRKASINGSTQIRAGVIRPEVVIPSKEDHARDAGIVDGIAGMEIGAPVRIIRNPGFGQIVTITALPPEKVKIETESEVRTVEVEFADGSRKRLPRANVEIIEK